MSLNLFTKPLTNVSKSYAVFKQLCQNLLKIASLFESTVTNFVNKLSALHQVFPQFIIYYQ